MPTLGFSDLTSIPTQTQVWNQELLPALQNPPSGQQIRVTDWFLGGVYRAMGMAVALLRVNARIAIATLTYAGFEDYVFGRVQVPTPPGGAPIDVTGWAPLIAKQRYGIIQSPATYTLRQFTISNTGGAYSNVKPGAIIVQFPSGNRYVLQGAQASLVAAMGTSDTTAIVTSTVGFPSSGTIQVDQEQIAYSGTTPTSFTGLTRGANGTTAASHSTTALITQTINIPANGTLQTIFRSEFPYSSSSTYNNDPSGASIQLVTNNFPGLSVTNPQTTFSAVAQAGPGVGTVTPSGAPSGNHTVGIQIVQSGTIAGATAGWQYSLDGAAWSATQFGASAVVGAGITVTLADAGGNPSFVSGTAFSFTTPGSDITQNGQIAQKPQSLGQQAAGMWPALAFQKDANGNAVPLSPTGNAYQLLAIAASQNVALAYAVTDGTVNNLVRLLIAGQNGIPALATTVAAVQQFFNALQMLTDKVLVATTTGRVVTPALSSGSIQVKQAQLATAQALLTQRLQSYYGGADPAAALSINGLVDYDYIVSLIRTLPGVPPGGVPVGALTLAATGGPPAAAQNIQLPIAANGFEVAQLPPGFNAATAFSWTAI